MLTLPDLESTYDLLAEALDRVPPARRELLLTKLALLLANELGDRGRIGTLVEAALSDLD